MAEFNHWQIVDLLNRDIQQLWLLGCDLSRINLSRANLEGAILEGANLTGSNLAGPT